MYLGGATFAWVSDYAQIHVVDAQEPAIADLESVGEQAFSRGWHAGPDGAAIYTADCLRQEVRVLVHDSEPAASLRDAMLDRAWTRTAAFTTWFPSGRFVLSSPSKAGGEHHAPTFLSPARHVAIRVSWLELDEMRYDAFRPVPDVIQLDVFPAP